MIRFERARLADAKALAYVSWRAFDNDVFYGAPRTGGPPGYRSAQWQARIMKLGTYYKILSDHQVIGGLIVFDKGQGHYELGRVFLDPDYQNQGIGGRAIQFLEQAFPQARRWTLGTPRWNLRTQHFYEKMGYTRVGEDGPEGWLYEKTVTSQAEPGQ